MDIVRQSFVIVVVFALLWTALSFLRKKGWAKMPSWAGIRRTKTASGLLESRGKLMLTARHSIHLIRIGERNMIIALHPDGVTFLGDALPAADGKRKEMATS
jgi:flagellar biogenesis protein FliO